MSRVLGASLVGVDGVAVEVEVRISSLLPRVDVVGLAEAAVRESTARVRAAIGASGLPFPDRRVTVNLAPAGVRKAGAGLDLPIALGILAAAGVVDPSTLEGVGFVGELALDGRLRPVRGALALALALRDAGCRRAVVPAANAAEAALAPEICVVAADELAALLRSLGGGAPLPRAQAPKPPPTHPGVPDLRDVRGQEHARRALEIAAAGGHALLLRGPPGAGKTMLACRLPGLLPPLDADERVEVTRIHGAAGRLVGAGAGAAVGGPQAAAGGAGRAAGAAGPDAVMWHRPFRAPHHTASVAGLLGGGSPPRPGEVSLAHRGVLFLDELPEFQRGALESLRQVLEEHRAVIARARMSCTFPAHFQLVAAANPCPCGWRLSAVRDCRCDDGAIARYTARVSGPLLDRIDLHVNVPPVRWPELEAPASGASSDEVRARVVAARGVQAQRLRLSGIGVGWEGSGDGSGGGGAHDIADTGGRHPGGDRPRTNAELPDAALDALVAATPDARALLGRAVDRLALSARAARRVLRVARTVADLAGEERVGPAAIAEALSLR